MSTANKISEYFKSRRLMLGLTQQELADALLLTRNYVTQIEGETRKPSARVISALDTLVDSERRKIRAQPTMEEFEVTGGRIKHSDVADHVAEGSDKYATDAASRILQEVEERFALLIQAAAGDPGRLGWIRERMDDYLQPPERWNANDKRQVMLDALDAAKKKIEQRELTAPGSQYSKETG